MSTPRAIRKTHRVYLLSASASQITEPGPEANKWAAQVSVHNNKTGEEQWFPLPENFWNPEAGLRTALRYGMELVEGKLAGLTV